MKTIEDLFANETKSSFLTFSLHTFVDFRETRRIEVEIWYEYYNVSYEIENNISPH